MTSHNKVIGEADRPSVVNRSSVVDMPYPKALRLLSERRGECDCPQRGMSI